MSGPKKHTGLVLMLALVMIFNLVFTGMVFAATGNDTEYRFPTASTVSDNSIDITYVSWAYTANIYADDYNYANATPFPDQGSDFLVASDFGFSADTFPSNATISGIEVVIDRACSKENTIQDYRVQLFNGTPFGDNKANAGTYWSSSNTDNYYFEEITYGGSDDLWGLSSVSISDITSSGFGVGISVINNSTDSQSGQGFAFVDYMKIKIYYTLPALITPYLYLSEPTVVTYDGNEHSAVVACEISGTIDDIQYNGSSVIPTAADFYWVTADFTPADSGAYETLNDADVGYFVINAATPSVYVNNSPVTYDGTPKTAEVLGSIPGVVSDIKYNGSSDIPIGVGTYAVTADFTPTGTTNYYSLDDAPAGNFVIEPPNTIHTVTLLIDPHEGGVVSGDGSYDEGARVTVSATPNPGYEFVGWTEDDVIVSKKATYRFTMGTNDRILVANFQAVGPTWPKEVRLSVSDLTSSSVTLNLSQPVQGADKYIVIYVEDNLLVRVEFAADDGTSLGIGSLSSNTAYVFSVQAVFNEEETTDGPSKRVKTLR